MESLRPCFSRLNQWEGCSKDDTEETDPADPFLTETYHYDLPSRFIAQEPLRERDRSRLLVLCHRSGALKESFFCHLREYLQEGDLIVINNSKVFPARLVGRKHTGGKVDLLLLRPCPAGSPVVSTLFGGSEPGNEWTCLIRSSRRPKPGQALLFPKDMRGEVVGPDDGGTWRIRFNKQGQEFFSYLEHHGLTPLPPYIKRDVSAWPPEDAPADRQRYQTVFARKVGSVAAPTAGLHFSEALNARLRETGIRFAEITLHVGQATFLPIRSSDIRCHALGPEHFSVSAKTAEEIQKAKQEGRRVVAVGTTVVRCLESLVSERGRIEPWDGWASLFILPGYRFHVVDAMITNFHLPRSSLLVLVSAFAGGGRIRTAYQRALQKGYRFFSYGDCMFIQ